MRGRSLGDKTAISVAIVDDEADFTRLVLMLLKKRGIDVAFVAHDGQEAIEMFKNAHKKPDVILMDHHMKMVDGVEATKRILDISKESRVIFLSADSHIKEDAMRAGACAFLNKPAGINEIINVIKNCR
jgi:two-component system chemotaxis response regulator CheY